MILQILTSSRLEAKTFIKESTCIYVIESYSITESATDTCAWPLYKLKVKCSQKIIRLCVLIIYSVFLSNLIFQKYLLDKTSSNKTKKKKVAADHTERMIMIGGQQLPAGICTEPHWDEWVT